MATTLKKDRKTPGVYITEFEAFPPSIVGVQTAVPAFIGYTEKAEISGKPVYFKAIKISSLADYQAIFGTGFEPKYYIKDVAASIPPRDPDSYDVTIKDLGGERRYFRFRQTGESAFYMYNSLRLFFDNGGGTCFIVSVGSYTDDKNPDGKSVKYDDLKRGLDVAGEQIGPTMLVIPDALFLPPDIVPGASFSDSEDNFFALASPDDIEEELADDALPTSAAYSQLVKDMLTQCNSLQDRVAIIDVYGTRLLKQDDPNFNRDLETLIENFRVAVGDVFLNYGMAYFPFLKSSVVQPNEMDYTNFAITDTETLANLDWILEAEADDIYGPIESQDTSAQREKVQEYIDDISSVIAPPEAVTQLNQNLVNGLPILQRMENIVASKINVLPPSGAMAGIYTFVDQNRGVWNAPANISMTSVIAPTVNLNDDQQGNLNVPLDGKAVNALRQFVGRGTVVWGARTLDGNSLDYRYIQVRRTLIYIEQSIKNALNPFVFAANEGNTWVTVVSMVSNFLQGVWSAGGLMGATASEAFTVECGLGSTMTPMDILNGYMIVQVTLQMIRPAEFIELTFKQKMEGIG